MPIRVPDLEAIATGTSIARVDRHAADAVTDIVLKNGSKFCFGNGEAIEFIRASITGQYPKKFFDEPKIAAFIMNEKAQRFT